jgi:hypothetical protein
MRRYLPWSCLVLLLASCGREEQRVEPVEPAKGKVLAETWDAAYFEGAKTGYFHTVTREVERDGGKFLVTSQSMNLTIKRYKEVTTLRMESGTEETASGKVLAVSTTQFLDKNRRLETRGRVNGARLLVRVNDDPTERALPWNDKVIGRYAQQRIFQDRQVKPGDKLEYLDYELSIASVITMTAQVKDEEEVDLLEAKQDGDKLRVERVKHKLLRVDVVPGKVEIGGQAVPLPRLSLWLDKDRLPVRTQSDLPGVGVVTLYRTTEAAARQEGTAPELLPDLGLNNMIVLNRPIERPHEARAVVYRITVKGDEDPATTFVRDARQEVQNVKDGTFELRVKSLREPSEEKPGQVKDEFVRSSHFINSDDEHVKALAARAVEGETDPWKKAQRIERWVCRNMKGNAATPFTTASQIARDLAGDCRQHAILTAAMCRAAGVPARTALGLVYVDDEKKGPVLAFHMWTEVWIKGNWMSLDATLGRGGIGAGHLKIADSSWADTQTLAPLLPVIRVMGRIKIEVVSVE